MTWLSTRETSHAMTRLGLVGLLHIQHLRSHSERGRSPSICGVVLSRETIIGACGFSEYQACRTPYGNLVYGMLLAAEVPSLMRTGILVMSAGVC